MKLRYERKYYVSNNKLDELRTRLMCFVRPDIHTSLSEDGLSQYTVRSIYYDTPFMDYYYEKMEGLENRNKFRIRVYDQHKPGDVAFLEIKQKLGPRIRKYRSTLQYVDVEKLLEEGDMDKYVISRPSDGKKFLFHYYKHSLKPVNLISYEREAYHGKFDDGVRITFDKNVRSAVYPKMSEIYSDARSRNITPDLFVLEIKYFTSHMPRWAKSLVGEFDLRHEAISKYSTGLDLHHDNTRKRFSPLGFTSMAS